MLMASSTRGGLVEEAELFGLSWAFFRRFGRRVPLEPPRVDRFRSAP